MTELGTLDAFDAQMILRALEALCVTVRQSMGNQPTAIGNLLLSWHQIMERAGIDRYSAADVKLRIAAEIVGKCEHGIDDYEYCPECSREYKRAAKEAGLE